MLGVVQTVRMDPRRFASLVDECVGRAGVSVAGESAQCGFGSSATKVNGSIFAMLSKGLTRRESPE
jgi:hypothetical protein